MTMDVPSEWLWVSCGLARDGIILCNNSYREPFKASWKAHFEEDIEIKDSLKENPSVICEQKALSDVLSDFKNYYKIVSTFNLKRLIDGDIFWLKSVACCWNKNSWYLFNRGKYDFILIINKQRH